MAKELRVVYLCSGVMSLWAYLLLFGLVQGQLMEHKFPSLANAPVGINKRFEKVRSVQKNDADIERERSPGLGPHLVGVPAQPIGEREAIRQIRKKQDNNFARPADSPYVAQPGFQSANRKTTTIKLAEHPDCVKDVKMYCVSSTNNFAVLDCLQNDLKSDQVISEACQHVVWGYKKNLTTDIRFESAAKEVCKDELDKFTDCRTLTTAGHMIPCLIEYKANISSPNCKTFLVKMASIVFSDYRLIYKFAESCAADIEKLDCGRLHKENDDSPHSQGRTVECLSNKVKDLSENCKHEILRIAELQADDYHLDRPLFYSCREDRERLCKRTRAGSGKVYKCLLRHKFDRDMSSECREKLTHRQLLMQANYKVNKGLAQACQQDIVKHHCIRDKDPGFKHARLSKVVLCLEHVMKDGGEVEPDCVIELKEVRHSLMEDYQISPEIVAGCAEEIRTKCNGGVHREGKTLHCLMDLAKPKPVNHKMQVEISDICQRELEKVIKEADVGEDWTIDPALREACEPIVEVHCRDVKGGEGRVLNCLMEHIESTTMTAVCEERLLELHYFLARDFSLDPRLYKYCHKDAEKLCSTDGNWHEPNNMTPERGPLVFACLYNHLKLYPKQINQQARPPTVQKVPEGRKNLCGASDWSDENAIVPHSLSPDTYTFSCLYRNMKAENEQLSRACAFEIRRVMRQRAIRVELEPRIEEPCMADLGAFCSERVEEGDEMECLQDNFDELSERCQWAVGNFTEDEDSDPNMDKLLMKYCSPMIKKFCDDYLKSNAEPGDVMDCLINHKKDNDMDERCEAGIEHHQLITLKDYHFSVKFKEACKEDVLKQCPGVRKKSEVVECLSIKVRDAVLTDRSHAVSKRCRRQLSFELLQRSETIKLDPKLQTECELDIRKFCPNVTPGNSNMIECLKKSQKMLSQSCHTLLFNREVIEAKDTTADYLLMHTCKKMIKRYCMNEQPSDIFSCLKKRKQEEDFDAKCRKVIVERQRQRNKDIRLSPKLMSSCSPDIKKFCYDQLNIAQRKPVEVEGLVLQCLKARFAQRHQLTDTCAEHVRGIIKEAALDYQQDPQLMTKCKKEIQDLCSESFAGDLADPDGGRVIECLKENLAARKITLEHNHECIKEVARVLAEDQADIQVDPLLYRECVLDIKHYCDGIPRGEGRQMSCLLAALEDKKVKLRPRCEKMLRDRVNMWELAAKVAPPNTFQELVQQVTTSDSRNYFMGVIFAVIGMIFIGGLMCGRVTKRVRAELKNR